MHLERRILVDDVHRLDRAVTGLALDLGLHVTLVVELHEIGEAVDLDPGDLFLAVPVPREFLNRRLAGGDRDTELPGLARRAKQLHHLIPQLHHLILPPPLDIHQSIRRTRNHRCSREAYNENFFRREESRLSWTNQAAKPHPGASSVS